MNVTALGATAAANTRVNEAEARADAGFSGEMLRQLATTSLGKARQIEDAAENLQRSADRQADIAGLLSGVIKAAQAFAASLEQAQGALEGTPPVDECASPGGSPLAATADPTGDFDAVLPRMQDDFDNWWQENYWDKPNKSALVGDGVWIGDMYLELADRRGNAHIRDADGLLVKDDLDRPVVVRPGQEVSAVAARVPDLLRAWESQYGVAFPDSALVLQGREAFGSSTNSDLYNAMGNWQLAMGLNTAGWALSPGSAQAAVAAGGSRPYLNSDLSVNQDWVSGSAAFEAKMADLAGLIRDKGVLSEEYLEAVRV